MSITRHHNDWLSLVPNSGPFLSFPVLVSAFPQGLDAHDADHARRLRMAFEEWDEDQSGRRADPKIHREWIKFVLGETLGFEELLAEGQAIPQTLKSEVAEYHETLRPDWVVNDPATKKARLLVQVYPRSQSLTKPVQTSRWKTSPDTRMMQLLHDTGIRLGIVTNGEHWMLVNAPKNETTGFVSWYANLWLEEPVTLRAFRTLLSADRFFSVQESETLEALLEKSAADQQEVTDQLGYQVRKAVEVLIQALDKADQDHGRKLLADVDEKVLYESALTVMMRLVFLFCAEERELLLLGDDLYDKNYAVSTLREQLQAAVSEHSEDILGLRYDAWTRLLTTFRAVYAGVKHDRLKLPAYGGSLFNPDRFPFLEGRKAGTSWKETEATPLPVSNRTVLHLLEALQVLQTKIGNTIEARTLSFRSLDIEQIGHVYEGLLDHTATRATEPMLGLQGTRDKEPEISVSDLERLAAKGEKELLKFLKDETGRSETALKKGWNAELDDQLVSRFGTACQDSQLWKRVKPFAGLARLDTNGYPVVVTTGSLFVTSGTDRRSSGTHYTPKSLTEPIVQYTLEPLVYAGPAEGLPKDQWKLRSAKELLALKICDMACGSGAFLVQACRYMSARLLEAWDAVQRADPGSVRITPEGEPSTGQPGEILIPDDPDERQTYALRIVAQRCLYGVDKNPLAVEMTKLSLWLLTLAKDKPFEFLDHAIRCGDSLVGIHNLNQLRKFNLDGKGEDNRLFLQFLDKKIKEAIALRSQIEEMQSNTVEDVEAQDRMLREANEKIDRLKCAADMLISAEFGADSASDKRASLLDASIQVALHFNDADIAALMAAAKETLAGQRTFHWPLEFPEVFATTKYGFSAVVGNPPFLPITAIDWSARRYIESQFDCAVGRHNTFSSFAEQALRVTSESASIGLVVPDRLFLNVQYEPLRSLLLNTLSLSDIMDFSGAFNATVDAIAFIGHKRRRSDTIRVIHPDAESQQFKVKSFSQRSLATAFDGAINIYVEPEDANVYSAVKTSSCPLGEVADVKDGIIQGAVADLLFIDRPLDDQSFKLLFGADVTRYGIKWSGKYVNYKPTELMRVEVERRGPNTRPGLWMRNAGVFEKRKILTRQTSDRIIGAIDDNNYYYANTLHGTSLYDHSEECGYTLEYLLALLNSRLMNYVYAILTGEVGKTFAQIKLDTLKRLPIYNKPKDEGAQRLGGLAKQVGHASLDQRKILYAEIDRLVFKLYGIPGTTVDYVSARTREMFGE